MTKDSNSSKKRNRRLKNLIPLAFIVLVFAGIPMIFLNFQAKRSGMTWGSVIQRILNKAGEKDKVSGAVSNNTIGEKVDFLDPKLIGDNFIEPSLISNVAVADLDHDGLLDVIVCDCRSNTVSWIRQHPAGTYTERVLADNLFAPAHIQVIDFDKDGDNDIMVAVLGCCSQAMTKSVLWSFLKMMERIISKNM